LKFITVKLYDIVRYLLRRDNVDFLSYIQEILDILFG